MNDFANSLVGSPLWDPHGHCFLWEPPLLWLLVVSNVVIALAYFSIPFALVTLVRKRRDLIHRWVFWAFALFILGCGLTHAIYVVTIWRPIYWVQGGIDAFTALASLATAVALWPLLPRLLALPNHSELRRKNEELEAEIEKRKAAEEQARASEERFRRLLESAPDGIVVTDDKGTIRLVNAATEQMLGYGKEELVGREVEVLVPEERRAAHESHRERYMQSPEKRPMGVGRDLEALKKDGTGLPVEISLSPLGSYTDSDHAVMSIIRDISPRKRYERELRTLNSRLARQNLELESVNTELNSFAYSVSHDLRAPLRAIEGFAQILSKEQASELSSKAAHSLGRIRENASQMGRLIDDLLSLSRLGRQELKIQEVDHNELVTQVLSELNAETRTGTEILVGDLPGSVADQRLLKQVYLNLIGNAFKYSRNRETVRIEVGAEEREDEIVYFVKDNGVGFDPSYAEQIFGVFQRLHTSDEFEGTGVGLSIVQRVIHRHGGRIWADGKPDEGAAIFFSIPRRAEQEDQQ